MATTTNNSSNIFVPRLTIPEDGNPYYNTKANGGYSTAIKGNNTNKKLDVYRNCVGHSLGRFHEILQDKTFSLLKPVNAELFIKYADKSLDIGNTPRLGAIMVWEGVGSHPGHVANVEQIKSDTEVVTSESGWSASKDFWIQSRKKGTNGNWGQSSTYKFLGFIYNPAPCCSESNSSNTTQIINIIDATSKKAEVAKHKDTSLSGSYKITAKDGLNLRLGAGTNKEILITIPFGSIVNSYGYYNLVGATKWLYVTAIVGGITYTGYVSSAYLKKG